MQAATTDQFQFLDGLAAQQKQNRLLKVLVREVTYGVCRFCSHFTNSVLNAELLGKERNQFLDGLAVQQKQNRLLKI